MTVFILAGLFIGGLIGARRTVLVLLPAAAFALGTAAAIAMLRPAAHDWNALHITVLLLFLQVGYLCGAGIRMFAWPPGIIGEQKRLRSS